MNLLKPGTLLVAEPFLRDPSFARSVVLLCEYDAEGSFGLTLNLKHPCTLSEVLSDAENIHMPLYHGGPVGENTLHFIHGLPKQIPGGIELMNHLYWGGDFNAAFKAIADSESAHAKIRFFAGYAGWSQGQLDEEVEEKSWFILDAKPSFIFQQPTDDFWKNSIKMLGKDYENFINSPPDPILN